MDWPLIHLIYAPICKSKYIKYFGIGTEKVEDYTKKLFPKARVERMDMDTTSKKGSHETILQNMKDEKNRYINWNPNDRQRLGF